MMPIGRGTKKQAINRWRGDSLFFQKKPLARPSGVPELTLDTINLAHS